MGPNTRESPASPARRSPALTIRPTNRNITRKTSTVSLPSGMTSPFLHSHHSPECGNPVTKKSTGLEARPKGWTRYEFSEPEEVQRILKFRTGILALDPCAKFFVDGNTLVVIHSRCHGEFIQKAANDLSNFRDHVSICQSTRPSTVAPVRPTQLPCPGFNFEELCGKVYRSLPHHERQQVTTEIQAAGLTWLDSRERYIISTSCLGKGLSNKGSVRPCKGCAEVVQLSDIRGVLLRITPRPKHEFFNPFLSVDATGVGAQDKKAAGTS